MSASGRGESLDDILGSMTMVAEGVKTALTTFELAKRYGVEMPVSDSIYRVVTGELTPAEAYRGLRRPGYESEPG